MAAQSVGATPGRAGPGRGGHSRELFWHTLGRLALLYFVPLILLAIFFNLQYRNLLRDGRRAHLQVIAEQQANTFDLFLRERLVNLDNVIDDPRFGRERARDPEEDEGARRLAPVARGQRGRPRQARTLPSSSGHFLGDHAADDSL